MPFKAHDELDWQKQSSSFHTLPNSSNKSPWLPSLSDADLGEIVVSCGDNLLTILSSAGMGSASGVEVLEVTASDKSFWKPAH